LKLLAAGATGAGLTLAKIAGRGKGRSVLKLLTAGATGAGSTLATTIGRGFGRSLLVSAKAGLASKLIIRKVPIN
jgi:hypothetical protein